ncbi:MAG: serine hydrolase [Alcanivoracaceae bacterium]|nr:serine hydrolase [Alcanivoracaceae bacterium]
MKLRGIAIGLFALMAAIGGSWFAGYAWPKITFLWPGHVQENFRHLEHVFPVRTISRSSAPRPWELAPEKVSVQYQYDDENSTLDEFLQRSATTSFIVIHHGKIIDERYFGGYGGEDHATSFSVAKSYVSTLVGIALKEGLIRSLDDDITEYVPSLRESGFHGASIADVLQMSSGIDFSERYDDDSTDAFRIFDQMYLWRHGINDIAEKFGSNAPAGQRFHYASINTQALGLLVSTVSGRPLGEYLQEKLWQPLGATHDASWMTDVHGDEVAFMGLNAIPRDFARLGLLYLHQGRVGTQQLLPEDWVKRATTPDKPWLQPGQIDHDWGYQYQWWVPREGQGDYSAIGIWGQFIYVNPRADLVIVKTSADADFKAHEFEAMTVFRTIADVVSSGSQE